MNDVRAGIETHLRGLGSDAQRAAETLGAAAADYARRVRETLRSGGRLFFCGNGGSAATVEHVATEYVVRLKRERRALAAHALTAGSAQLTAAANDFGFERAFARALEGLARPGDLLVLHSTSGASPNLLEAARSARRMGVGTVALLGETGGALAPLVDLAVCVPARDPARIQEIQLAIEHAVAEQVEAAIVAEEEEA